MSKLSILDFFQYRKSQADSQADSQAVFQAVFPPLDPTPGNAFFYFRCILISLPERQCRRHKCKPPLSFRGFSVPGNVRRVRCDAIEAFSCDRQAEEAEEAIAHAGVQVR